MVENVTPFHQFPAFMTQAHHGVVTPCPSNVWIWACEIPTRGKENIQGELQLLGLITLWARDDSFACCHRSEIPKTLMQKVSDPFLSFSGFWRWNWRFAILKGLHLQHCETTLAFSCLRKIYATHAHTQLVMFAGFGSMIPFMYILHICQAYLHHFQWSKHQWTPCVITIFLQKKMN